MIIFWAGLYISDIRTETLNCNHETDMSIQGARENVWKGGDKSVE